MKKTMILSGITRQLLAVSVASLLLTGCMTGKKAEETAAEAATDAQSGSQTPPSKDQKNLLAKGGTTAESGYVDPFVSTGQRRQKMAATMPAHAAGQKQATPPQQAANTFPPPPQQPSASLADVVNQPTGVRAGSFSIFASTAPPPAMAPTTAPQANTQQAAAATSTAFNATSGSVFAAHQPMAPSACMTDNSGKPINC